MARNAELRAANYQTPVTNHEDMKKLVRWMARGFLAVVSGILWVLSMPPVRDAIWNRAVGKGKQKVIDAKARIVESSAKEEGVKKDEGLLG